MKKKNAGHSFLTMLLFLMIFVLGGTSVACASEWKFGSQLRGREKEIYQILEKKYSAIQSANEVNGITFQMESPIEEDELRSLQWYRTQCAFLLDHSELFWIQSLVLRADMTWNVQLHTLSAPNITIFTEDRYAGIRGEIAGAQQEISRAAAAVKKYRGRYAKVKAAHDYIIRLTTYPKETLSAYCHAVTGPLLGKYAHKGVCEAYAWLFDIICEANGIPCVILTGGSHAWNYVQMEDGKWYLVDVTWDDSDSGSKISYDYFLVGANTLVDGKKIKQTHSVASTRTIYELNNVTPLKYPTLSRQAYKKSAGQGSKGKKVASVKITSTTGQVKAGRKLTLTATVLPAAAANKKLRWTSSNTKYATVTAKGVVKTKKAGKGKTVKITAKATDGSGKKATIQIKLK